MCSPRHSENYTKTRQQLAGSATVSSQELPIIRNDHGGGHCNNHSFSPDATLESLVTPLAVGNNDGPVGDVDHEVAEYVGEELLIDQLVHRALPFVEDLDKNSKSAGVGHISGVGHSHNDRVMSDSCKSVQGVPKKTLDSILRHISWV